jgi:ABC-2 type transport system ATP-binding protein
VSEAPILKLVDLEVVLARTQILENVNLTVSAELVWLTGRNGAGKSTLMRALAGLLPFKGDVEIMGFSPRSIDARSKFAFVPDEPALYEDLTLLEHCRFQALAYRQPQAEARMLEFLEKFNLEGRLGEFPSSHSRGMRQKLSLSLCLGLELPLLVLDEPFNGLDAPAQALLSSALRDRVKAGHAVVVSAHQGDLAKTMLEGNVKARVLLIEDANLKDTSLEVGVKIESQNLAELNA